MGVGTLTDASSSIDAGVRTDGDPEDVFHALERRIDLLETENRMWRGLFLEHLSSSLRFQKVVERFSEVTVLGFVLIGVLNVVGLLTDVVR